MGLVFTRERKTARETSVKGMKSWCSSYRPRLLRATANALPLMQQVITFHSDI